jgi:hypothetical protein
MSLLVRARVMDPLLAWRGLANSVATPAAAGGSTITMPHQNDVSERRINQLFVPGLAALPWTSPGLRVEQGYPPRRSRELAQLPLHVSADGLRSGGR